MADTQIAQNTTIQWRSAKDSDNTQFELWNNLQGFKFPQLNYNIRTKYFYYIEVDIIIRQQNTGAQKINLNGWKYVVQT